MTSSFPVTSLSYSAGHKHVRGSSSFPITSKSGRIWSEISKKATSATVDVSSMTPGMVIKLNGFHTLEDLNVAVNKERGSREGNVTDDEADPTRESSVNLSVGSLKNKRRAKIVSKLGEGGFAYVYVVQSRTTQGEKKSKSMTYALKATSTKSYEHRKRAEHESKLLQSIQHANIVTVVDVGCYSSKSSAIGRKKLGPCHFIMMEYCADGTVLDLIRLHLRTGTRYNTAELCRSFGQLCNAVSFLHSQQPPIIHRDLKPDNMLLCAGGTVVKLCDFGSAVIGKAPLVTPEDRARADDIVRKSTTQIYRAPEMVNLFSNKELNDRTDIWALGCTLFIMAFQRNCFEEGSNLAILSANYSAPKENAYGEKLLDLIDRMICLDVDDRVSISEVICCTSALSLDRPLPERKVCTNKLKTKGSSLGIARNHRSIKSKESFENKNRHVELSLARGKSYDKENIKCVNVVDNDFPILSQQNSLFEKNDRKNSDTLYPQKRRRSIIRNLSVTSSSLKSSFESKVNTQSTGSESLLSDFFAADFENSFDESSPRSVTTSFDSQLYSQTPQTSKTLQTPQHSHVIEFAPSGRSDIENASGSDALTDSFTRYSNLEIPTKILHSRQKRRIGEIDFVSRVTNMMKDAFVGCSAPSETR